MVMGTTLCVQIVVVVVCALSPSPLSALITTPTNHPASESKYEHVKYFLQLLVAS